jgi:predicted ATPase
LTVITASVRCRRFIGRRRELDFLVQCRRDLAKGHGRIVLVRGDAGIGKSRLIRAFLEATGSARGRVAIGRCRTFASRPYEALLEVLDAFASPGAKLIPAASQDEQRSRIVDALLASASRHASVAILEDLHWADRETVAVLARLGEHVSTKRLLIVATYRGSDVHADHPLFAQIAALLRSPAVSEIALDALSRPETNALIDGALEGAGQVSADARSAVASVAEGNPFFIEELLRSALDRTGRSRSAPAWPATVRAAIRERIAHLEPADRAIIAQAAVIGRRFDLELLAQASGIDPPHVLATLARARALQIVEETDDPSTFSFRHALTREVTFDDQLAAQRRPLHRRIADALEARGVDDRTLDALAYHWSAAGEGAKALLYGERAGDHAQSVHDYEGAVACYERTRALLADQGPDLLRITSKIGGSFFRAGAMDRAAAWYRTAWTNLKVVQAVCKKRSSSGVRRSTRSSSAVTRRSPIWRERRSLRSSPTRAGPRKPKRFWPPSRRHRSRRSLGRRLHS